MPGTGTKCGERIIINRILHNENNSNDNNNNDNTKNNNNDSIKKKKTNNMSHFSLSSMRKK